MTNYKGFGRMRIWPIWNILPVFACRCWENSWKP